MAAVLTAFCAQGFAQSLISGDIAGVIADPSGAVMPSAKVDLRSLDTGTTQSTTSNQTGAYRFSLLKPGHYVVAASQTGFQKAERSVTVEVGQIANADLTLTVGASTQTVEVMAAAPLISTEPSMNTAFSQIEVEELPSPGGDMTNIAQTVSGVVVNTTGGYGNFTLNGLPATSNLFTVNGENDMDPYFNISNSGASNLLIGSNEVQEATVIANPYGGQYGQLAGAQISYVTKSGTNQFHGNANYYWNGRDMNANDFFLNQAGVGRPFSNANQWAASVGGPIRKNSTFFFVDTEGLRFVLPNAFNTTIPTPQFTAAALNNIQLLQPNEYSHLSEDVQFVGERSGRECGAGDSEQQRVQLAEPAGIRSFDDGVRGAVPQHGERARFRVDLSGEGRPENRQQRQRVLPLQGGSRLAADFAECHQPGVQCDFEPAAV